METFKIFMKVIWKIIAKLFEVGLFAWCAFSAAKELQDYFDSDEI